MPGIGVGEYWSSRLILFTVWISSETRGQRCLLFGDWYTRQDSNLWPLPYVPDYLHGRAKHGVPASHQARASDDGGGNDRQFEIDAGRQRGAAERRHAALSRRKDGDAARVPCTQTAFLGRTRLC